MTPSRLLGGIFAGRCDHRLIIDGGMVRCPVRGIDIDIDRCASCASVVAIDPGAIDPVVACRADRSGAWSHSHLFGA